MTLPACSTTKSAETEENRMTMPKSILIIGAGQAGGCAAAALRREGYQGRITLAGVEPHRPYERPALSKGVLHDASAEEALFLHKPEFHDGLEMEWLAGADVQSLDPGARLARTASGESLAFDRCLITTGGRARLLPGLPANAPNVHYLRCLDDARRLRERLLPGASVIVIGGGFLGLEFASMARCKGMSVTVCEAGTQLLGRAAPPQVGAWLQARHEEGGARVLCGDAVAAVEAGEEGVSVMLANGVTLRADFLLISIGQLPNVELAEQAGLTIDNGITVDSRCETSVAGIFSAGDCASHVSRFLQRRIRLESWQNAQEQAQVAARGMLDLPASYDVVPWFWSDQLGMNLQMLGLPDAGLAYYMRGQPADSTFSLYGFDGHLLRYALAVNSGSEMTPLRRLMAAGASIDAERLADPAQRVRDTVKAALG
jgi:3-phenylpropionate/trans-cinnamate dioxygenase ferredoxin reductase subunit